LPTHYHSLWEVIRLWFHSADFSKYDTLCGFRFLWLSRSGQLLQFMASLTIIAEIIGKERIIQYRKSIAAIFNFKDQWFKMKVVVQTLAQISVLPDKEKVSFAMSIGDKSDIIEPVLLSKPKLLLRLFVLFYRLITNFLNSAITEIILSPASGYLWLSERERLFKSLAFAIFIVGFLMSLMFS
jgi:hypothetical protein